MKEDFLATVKCMPTEKTKAMLCVTRNLCIGSLKMAKTAEFCYPSVVPDGLISVTPFSKLSMLWVPSVAAKTLTAPTFAFLFANLVDAFIQSDF